MKNIKIYSAGSLLETFVTQAYGVGENRSFFLATPKRANDFSVKMESFSKEIEWISIGFQYAEVLTQQRLWHYVEITIEGAEGNSVTVTGLIDGVSSLNANNTITIPAGKTQITRKVYFNSMAFGYVPHIKNGLSDTAQMIHVKPVSLPLETYSRLRNSSRVWVTYIGNVTFQFSVDGRDIMETAQVLPAATQYRTENFTIPNWTGNIFQWRQVAGTGDIYNVETDESMKNIYVVPTKENV